MSTSGEPLDAEPDALPDGLVESLNRAGRAANRVLVRWLLDTELPLLSACVLVALDPPEKPMGVRAVADAIGISVEDANHALQKLRALGYAREEKRRFEPTEEGRRLYDSLVGVRREALAAFMSGLSQEERRDFAAALTR